MLIAEKFKNNFITTLLKNEKIYFFIEILISFLIVKSSFIPLNREMKIGIALFIMGNSILGYLNQKNIFKMNSIVSVMIFISLFFRIYYSEKLVAIGFMLLLIIYFYRILILFDFEKYLFSYVIILGSLIRIEKMLVYKKYHFDNMFIIITIVFMIYLCVQNIGLKKIFGTFRNVDKINEIIVLSFPFFLVRRSSNEEILWLFIITSIFYVFKNKKYIYQKICCEKKIFLFSFIPLFSFLISILFKGYSEYTKGHYFDYLGNTALFLLMLINFISVFEIKKLIKIMIIVSIIPICLVFTTLIEINFAFGRITGFWDISIYSFTILLIATILVYNMFAQEDYSCLSIGLLLYILILFSGTRMIWLVSILTFLSILILLMKKKFIFLGIIFITFGILSWKNLPMNNPIKSRAQAFFNLQENNSSGARIFMYKEAIVQFKGAPFLGNGFVTYGKNAILRHKNEDFSGKYEHQKREAYGGRYHAHSNFFELLCGTGIFGILSFYGFNLYLFYLLVKNRKHYRDLCNIGILTFLCFHLYGISDVTLYMARVTEIYFYVLGIILSYILYSKNFIKKGKDKNEDKVI